MRSNKCDLRSQFTEDALLICQEDQSVNYFRCENYMKDINVFCGYSQRWATLNRTAQIE